MEAMSAVDMLRIVKVILYPRWSAGGVELGTGDLVPRCLPVGETGLGRAERSGGRCSCEGPSQADAPASTPATLGRPRTTRERRVPSTAAFPSGTRVLLRYWPHGQPGIVTGQSRGWAVEWRDLGTVGKHPPASLFTVSATRAATP